MSGVDPDALREFLDDRPDRERALEAVLGIDTDMETWTFDDVEVDSGTFGELVSRGIVEKVDGEYRVVDREMVERVLAGDASAEGGDRGASILTDADVGRGPDLNLGAFGDRSALVGLMGALGLLFVMRVIGYPQVFRENHVVSPGNDPYHYRWGLNELLAESSGPTDFGVVADLPWWAQRRPFTHVANWWLTELMGGSPGAAEMVAAWLAVVSALAVGVLLYILAVLLTDDPRVGIAAVVLFAVMPVQAVYSGVGFLEHRLHQYFWLAVTLVALTWFAVDLQRRFRGTRPDEAVGSHLRLGRTWFVAAVLALALGISVHAWGGGALMYIPLAGYVALRTIVDVREDVRPLFANLPLVIGLAVGSVMAALAHIRWDWHDAFVAFTPLLVFTGAVAVLTLGEVWRRFKWSTLKLVAVQATVGVGGLAIFWLLRPDERERIVYRAGDLMFRESEATEATSLFAPDSFFIFGPIEQIGVSFYLAVAVLVWAGYVSYHRYEPAWVLMAVYTSYFAILAIFQARFAAQLGILVAVLGGLGFVYFLSKVDLAREVDLSGDQNRPRRPGSDESGFQDRLRPSIGLPSSPATGVYLVGAFLLVCGLSLIFAPSFVAQTTYDDGEYGALVAIEDHADEVDRANSSENFALSRWGSNRMYNYFLGADARFYGYARDTYDPFRLSDDPDGWYSDEFDGEVGYVVLEEPGGDLPDGAAHEWLYNDYGLGGEDREALEHYQLLFANEDYGVVAFATVSGATIESSVEPGENVTVATDVEVEGASFTYERSVEADEDGDVEVVVPYPGEYAVGNGTAEISTVDVVEGNNVEVE